MKLSRFGTRAPGILAIGLHQAIVQSMLDFDYLSGKKEPSVVGIISEGRTSQKFFFGRGETLIPCFSNLETVPEETATKVNWMLNVQSGRRAAYSTRRFFQTYPEAYGGVIFAENVPEAEATALIREYGGEKLILGPASVGFVIPGLLKLGAIGGTEPDQIQASGLTEKGNVAVVSTSGGMTNEFIRMVADHGRRLSFALSIGGERFPVTSLTKVLALAEEDSHTEALVYFGELGGVDEYEIVELMRRKKFTKPLFAYIGGVIDETFDAPMQFGHAKALALGKDESARAKRDALRSVGAVAPDTFGNSEKPSPGSREGRIVWLWQTIRFPGDRKASSRRER
jgi:ATP citrate (pro-S)-lyase